MKVNYFSILIFTTALFIGSCKDSTTTDPTPVTPPSGTVKDCSSLTGIAKLVCLSENVKASLSTSQVASLQLSYSKADAVKWSNLPEALTRTKRVGLQFSTLNASQLESVKLLIKEAMGTMVNEGYDEAMQILAADDFLNVNGGGATYGSGNYFIAFLGTPSTTGLWELQFGGHHLAVSNTYNNGKLTGATPSFRSVEPMAAFEQGGKTNQPMIQEQVALANFLKSLTTTQATTAKSSSMFGDLILGPGKDGQFPTTKVGLVGSTLTSAQRDLLMIALNTYIKDVDDVNAATITAKYTSELNDTYVMFSGTNTLETKGDYIRVDGPSIWFEWSTQGGIVIRNANHPHTVWRDRTGDYGGN